MAFVSQLTYLAEFCEHFVVHKGFGLFFDDFDDSLSNPVAVGFFAAHFPVLIHLAVNQFRLPDFGFEPMPRKDRISGRPGKGSEVTSWRNNLYMLSRPVMSTSTHSALEIGSLKIDRVKTRSTSLKVDRAKSRFVKSKSC